MTKRRTFETAVRVPDGAYAVTETTPRGRPSMARDVLLPSAVLGCLVAFLVVAAGILTAIIMALAFGMQAPDIAWAALGSMALGIGVLAALPMFRTQLEHYMGLQVKETRFDLVDDEPEPDDERLIEAVDGSKTLVPGSYRWRPGERRKLAAALFDARGNWRGKDKFTRSIVEPFIVNYSVNYPLIREDFRTWGWVDDTRRWTDYGIGKVREWLDP